jgi:hypothetical protein
MLMAAGGRTKRKRKKEGEHPHVRHHGRRARRSGEVNLAPYRAYSASALSAVCLLKRMTQCLHVAKEHM